MTGIANIFELMKNAKEMAGKAKELHADLARKTVVGSAGAGMVEATLNGAGELLCLKFAPGTVTPDDPEMLADLIVAAVADARKKSGQLREDAMREMTGGLDLSALGIELPNFL